MSSIYENVPVAFTSNFTLGGHSYNSMLDKIASHSFKIRPTADKTYTYFSRTDDLFGGYLKESGYKEHEYELYEYSRIIDTEAIVAKAFERKRALIFKNGFFLSSDNKDNIEYINRRIREIEYASNSTFKEILNSIALSVVSFHNSYIYIHRDTNNSGGKPRVEGDKEIEPIDAIFVLPTESIQRKLNRYGQVSKYKQYVTHDAYRIYDKTDVIHIAYNKRPGFIMGTPPLEAVKDDILALRRIEESVETLIYKNLFPMLHVKVGTESRPATTLRDGRSEVDVMTEALMSIEDDGGVVTSERVEIKAIGSESLALRVESYLNYFKNRVLIGLGVSPIDLGESDSAGRATGQIMSQTLKEAVIDFQTLIADFISREIFTQLLMESGKYKNEYEIPEGDFVSFIFNHVDQDAQIKLESHYINLAQQRAIGINEFRKECGFPELDEKGLLQIRKEWEAVNPEAKDAGVNQMQKKESGASKLTKNIANPKNQHNKDKKRDPIIDTIRNNIDNNIIIYKILDSHFNSFIDTPTLYTDNIVHNLSLNISDSISALNLQDENTDDRIEDMLFKAYLNINKAINK